MNTFKNLNKPNDVLALGNAIMDFLIELDDLKLRELNLTKGEMTLVDEPKIKEILNKVQHEQLKVQLCPGGSAANTLRGLALLGADVILYGKIGKDKHGEIYLEEIEKQGVKTRINIHHKITGKALTFITPDAERTFSVHLGAAPHLAPEEILEEDIEKSKIVHLEGYQLEGETKEAVLRAIDLAKKHKTLVSLDLADAGVIRRNKTTLLEIFSLVDIIFLNEKEIEAFLSTEENAKGKENQEENKEQKIDQVESLLELGQYVPTVVLKLGANGSLILHEDVIHTIKPFPAKAIDTTGAGDIFAAGFLYGFSHGWEMEKAGELGSLFASKVVEQIGVKINEVDAEELKKEINREL